MFYRVCNAAVLMFVLVFAMHAAGQGTPHATAADTPTPAVAGPSVLDAGSRLREPMQVLRRGDASDVVDVVVGPESVDGIDPAAPAVPDPEPFEALAAEPLTTDNQPLLTPYDSDCCAGGCGETCADCCCTPCGPSGRFWVRAEALIWWTKGMFLPPLVTTSPSGTSQADAGVLPGAEILFPTDNVLKNERLGGRIRAGMWLDPCNRKGVEIEYFGLARESATYTAPSGPQGNPIFARPFFNINPRDAAGALDPPAREDAELVSFPNDLRGTVTVGVHSELHSVAPHFRFNVCCKDWCWQDPCDPCNVSPGSSRFDFLVGYRYIGLHEGAWITEDLTSLDPANPGDFDILDRFDTYNDFHGFELGVVWERHHRRWFIEAMGKIALGNNRQVVDIFGTTVFTAPGGAPVTQTGGLLAQRTNIGRHTRDDFTAIPELGFTLGYHLTPQLSLTFGYTLLYWGGGVRPGEHIDLDVNPDLLPPERVPFEGALRPRFVFNDTDFWAQGFNLGLDYRW